MRVAVTQPNFLPWLGYFALLDQIDLWVSLDNVQHVRRSFIVRNRIKSPDGAVRWLTVRLEHAPQTAKINEVRLHPSDWWGEHLDLIRESYQKAPYFSVFFEELAELLPPRPDESTLGEYNRRIVMELSRYLGITLESREASEICPILEGSPEEKILTICDRLKPSEFYNFQTGVEVGLYHPEAFHQHGMKLFKQTYRHPEYRQQGNGFVPYLSVIDLIFNVGPEAALNLIRSGSEWTRPQE